jgi:hypothetical protein
MNTKQNTNISSINCRLVNLLFGLFIALMLCTSTAMAESYWELRCNLGATKQIIISIFDKGRSGDLNTEDVKIKLPLSNVPIFWTQQAFGLIADSTLKVAEQTNATPNISKIIGRVTYYDRTYRGFLTFDWDMDLMRNLLGTSDSKDNPTGIAYTVTAPYNWSGGNTESVGKMVKGAPNMHDPLDVAKGVYTCGTWTRCEKSTCSIS